jgi:hypothetical protein
MKKKILQSKRGLNFFNGVLSCIPTSKSPKEEQVIRDEPLQILLHLLYKQASSTNLS